MKISSYCLQIVLLFLLIWNTNAFSQGTNAEFFPAAPILKQGKSIADPLIYLAPKEQLPPGVLAYRVEDGGIDVGIVERKLPPQGDESHAASSESLEGRNVFWINWTLNWLKYTPNRNNLLLTSIDPVYPPDYRPPPALVTMLDLHSRHWVEGFGFDKTPGLYVPEFKWSPDGRRCAYVLGLPESIPNGESEAVKLVVFDVATHKNYTLLEIKSWFPRFAWTPQGNLMVSLPSQPSVPSAWQNIDHGLLEAHALYNLLARARDPKLPFPTNSEFFPNRSNIYEVDLQNLTTAKTFTPTLLLKDADDPALISSDGRWLVCRGWYSVSRDPEQPKNAPPLDENNFPWGEVGDLEPVVPLSVAFQMQNWQGKAAVPIQKLNWKHGILYDRREKKRYIFGGGYGSYREFHGLEGTPEEVRWLPGEKQLVWAAGDGLGVVDVEHKRLVGSSSVYSWNHEKSKSELKMDWDKPLKIHSVAGGEIVFDQYSPYIQLTLADVSADGKTAYFTCAAFLKHPPTKKKEDSSVMLLCACDLATGTPTVLAIVKSGYRGYALDFSADK